MKTVELSIYELGGVLSDNDLDFMGVEEVNFRHIRSKSLMEEAFDFQGQNAYYYESLVHYTYTNGDGFWSNTNVDLDTGEVIEVYEEQY